MKIKFKLILLISTLIIILINAKKYPLNKNENPELETKYWNRLARISLRQRLYEKPIVRRAKNVILFLGDGMGITTITAARILKGQLQNRSGEETKLIFENFPYVSLIKTYNVDNQVTDSAASANALLTGVKSNQGTLGVNAKVVRYSTDCDLIKRNSVSSILKWAIDSGKSAGIVTTAQITDASTAAAYAHISNRRWRTSVPDNMTGDCKDIARQLIEDELGTKLSVILGGGSSYLLSQEFTTRDGKSGFRSDNRNLINDWLRIKKNSPIDEKSYKFVESRSQLKDVNHKEVDYLFGLFNSDQMSYDLERNNSDEGEPSIEEMTRIAIKILSKNKNGFVLLVEGGNIDKAHHNNLATLALYDTVAFDKAIAKALTLVSRKDTLTVVTADHSHSLTINGYPKRGNSIFGIAGNDSKSKPYTTLIYGNGPGYQEEREDPSKYTNSSLMYWFYDKISWFFDKTSGESINPRYQSLSAIHLKSSAHGGEDVATYSTGPMAHLLQGTQEQSYIAHVMAFAACIGDYQKEYHCRRQYDRPSVPVQISVRN